jgi:hypothetical protein
VFQESDEDEKPSKVQKAAPPSAKQSTSSIIQDKNKGKPLPNKPVAIDNTSQKKNIPGLSISSNLSFFFYLNFFLGPAASNKSTSVESQKRSVDFADKSGDFGRLLLVELQILFSLARSSSQKS